MSTMVSNRRSTFGISCVRCDEELIAPDRSEYRAGTHIRHLWHCPKCSVRFEPIEQIPVEVMIADDIFPALLVA
jgi:transcriptional regulator NrdR family protein